MLVRGTNRLPHPISNLNCVKVALWVQTGKKRQRRSASTASLPWWRVSIINHQPPAISALPASLLAHPEPVLPPRGRLSALSQMGIPSAIAYCFWRSGKRREREAVVVCESSSSDKSLAQVGG